MLSLRVITLGCSKNTVDTEHLLACLDGKYVLLPESGTDSCDILVINTCGTAFPHPLGYVLTENYGVPHGKACAAFFPAFFERAQKFAPVKTEKLCSLCSAESDEIIDVISALADINIHISDEDAEKYSLRWAESVPKNFVSSPGSLTYDEAKQILASL